MSKEQHQSDQENKIPHVPGCLNRHMGHMPKKGVGKTCSHRWQAYEKMKDTRKSHYDWPHYKPLADAGQKVETAQTVARSKNLFPKHYKSHLDPPAEGDWDVKGDNFFARCFDPYWHEAHHVVPNSTLAQAIASVDNGTYTVVIRHGLASESYNLNDKKNMVMLPMDAAVAKAMRLPRHRQTATTRSHQGYSRHVLNRLTEIFNELAEQLAMHEAPKYKSVKKDIEALSENLFTAIVTSEAGSLDDMRKDEFLS